MLLLRIVYYHDELKRTSVFWDNGNNIGNKKSGNEPVVEPPAQGVGSIPRGIASGGNPLAMDYCNRSF